MYVVGDVLYGGVGDVGEFGVVYVVEIVVYWCFDEDCDYVGDDVGDGDDDDYF